MQEDDIHIAVYGRTGCIELNRPKALNALSFDMAVALTSQIEAWSQDDAISHIILSGSTPRAFCAGGDVRAIYDLILSGADDQPKTYFQAEYMTHMAVWECSKPVITLADGVVMGGGAGLMQAGSHAVVSQTTRFAMPESAIGLFPDAGASIFLGRCPRPEALLLGLTGHIIGAADCLRLGLANSMTPSEQMADLRAALIACDVGAIDDVIAAHRQDPGPSELQSQRAAINYIFAAADLVEIRDRAGDMARLKDDDFANKIYQALITRCPMTMAVYMRLLGMADEIPDFGAALMVDYHLAIRMTERSDFREGIRAVLVDKTNDARWSPAQMEDITSDQLDIIFDHAGLPALR